jgi:streptogramin lyase
MRCHLLQTLALSILPSLALAGTIDTIAGTGQRPDNGESGLAHQTNIGEPFGVEFGPDGALYIAEVANHRIRRLDLRTNKLTTVAGCGVAGYAGDGGPATKAKLNEPYEVRFDKFGNMFFVEMKNHIIRRVDSQTGKVSTIAGTGQPGYSGDGGPALKAKMKNPHSIALDEDGNIFVADIGNHRIRRIDMRTGVIESIAGNGERKMPHEDQQARDTPILGPRALFIEGSTMWIALREGHSVWQLNLKQGNLLHVAGTGERGYGGDGGLACDATFDGPKGIAVGPQGHIYVVDTENQAIRKIDTMTESISTIAGNGQLGSTGDGGSATEAQLARPHGVCVGEDGAIYIGDTINNRVRVVAP